MAKDKTRAQILQEIEGIHREPLEDVIKRNQPYLAKPISPETTFVYETTKMKGYWESPEEVFEFFNLISNYLFSKDTDVVAYADQYLRTWFSHLNPRLGVPRFISISHPGECSRDIFLNFPKSRNCMYAYKWVPG